MIPMGGGDYLRQAAFPTVHRSCMFLHDERAEMRVARTNFTGDLNTP